MIDTSRSEPGRPTESYFPLMHLPPEVRSMVFVEVLSTEYNNDVEDPYHCNQKMPKQQRRKKINKTCLLLANKQVYDEALPILYSECYLKVHVKTMWPWDESHRSSLISCRKSYPRDIRNLDISINTTEVSQGRCVMINRRGVIVRNLVERVATLCSEIAFWFGSLKNIVIRIPCPEDMCFLDLKKQSLPVALTDNPDCIQVHELERIFTPIGTLRASDSITLRCHRALKVEFDASFQQLAAIVRGSDALEDRSDMERAWFSVRYRAERVFPDPILEETLRETFWFMNEANDEMDDETIEAFWWGIQYAEKMLKLSVGSKR
ncbi:MAG: hypothetical protein LQ341_004511 [Variospora aurantia]|nr:MAG: hypothetical protein LQ341_004511 [Variospora aurantia]